MPSAKAMATTSQEKRMTNIGRVAQAQLQARPSFMSLPPEIRQQIFYFTDLVSPSGFVKIFARFVHKTDPPKPRTVFGYVGKHGSLPRQKIYGQCWHPRKRTGRCYSNCPQVIQESRLPGWNILQIRNKKFHEEANYVVFSNNKFEFQGDPACWLAFLMRKQPWVNHIPSVQFRFDAGRSVGWEDFDDHYWTELMIFVKEYLPRTLIAIKLDVEICKEHKFNVWIPQATLREIRDRMLAPTRDWGSRGLSSFKVGDVEVSVDLGKCPTVDA